jgi:Raf kinase inhibitor-like YbhB/YbcL family protein
MGRMDFDRPLPPSPYDLLPAVPSFTLESDDIAEGEELPLAHRHDSVGGDNVSPHLRWSGAPDEAKGFVVTCFDPDAPTGSGFWHWLQLGFDGSTTDIPQGAGSSSALAPTTFCVRNDFSEQGYGGAAPPAGDRPHRYIYAVHALDVPQLGIDAAVSPAFVGFHLFFHTIARATLTATYAQPA